MSAFTQRIDCIILNYESANTKFDQTAIKRTSLNTALPSWEQIHKKIFQKSLHRHQIQSQKSNMVVILSANHR